MESIYGGCIHDRRWSTLSAKGWEHSWQRSVGDLLDREANGSTGEKGGKMTDLEECAARIIRILGKMVTDEVAAGESVTKVLQELRSLETAEKQRCAALAEAAGDTELAKLILGGCRPQEEAAR